MERNKAERAGWPIRSVPLSAPESSAADLTDSTSPEERIAMMWPLALDAWALAGRPIPEYSRAEMPIEVRRLGDPSDADS